MSSSSSSHSYEIEIKSLLGASQKAEALKHQLKRKYPAAQLVEESKQLNHYFVGEDLRKLHAALSSHFSGKEAERFAHIVAEGKKPSVRTRQQNEKVLFVIKASIDDTTSSNGISRIEFEAEVPGMTLSELDQAILDAGFQYQAKWSRQREAYKLNDRVTLCIDKNAGYGYLAEFEAVVDDASGADQIQQELRQIMAELGVEELAQDRLERMFAFYNEHWPEYYGTENVFTIV